MPEKRTELNSAQREIILSERTFAGSGLNTISLKLRLPTFTAEAVQSAANEVLSSADVFSAALEESDGTWRFVPGAAAVRPCRILPAMPEKDVLRYTEDGDAASLNFPTELYKAEALPIRGGGTLLYVRFHHILTDGFGMSLFAERVLFALEGKPLPRSVFFEGALEEESADDAAFWRAYFADADFDSAVLPAAADDMKKTGLTAAPSGELTAEIERFAAACGVSVPYALAAAYAVYLSAATGKRDAVFLMPRLNRRGADMAVIGCYTLLVPVRITVRQDEPFSGLCRRLAESARAASAHKAWGYDKVLKVLREESIVSDTPSEFVFNFYRHAPETTVPHTVSISVAGAMHNHVTWNIFRAAAGLTFSFDLRRGVYDAETGRRLSDALLAILADGVQDKKISDIRTLGDAEHERLLNMRGREIPLDDTATIVSLFKDAVRKFSDRPALYAGDDALTFGGLDETSSRIAAALLKRGVRPGDRVAFMLGRDIRLIPTMLGILKSGACFIPVDPAYPKDRIRYILEDSSAAFLISSAGVSAAEGMDFLEIDALLGETADGFTPPEIAQTQLAYMIYTSGTTGTPKGVMLSHRGIVNIVHPENNPFNRDVVANGHGITAIGSICFDISLFEIFVPLLNGRFVELGNEEAMVNASALAAHINRHGADLLHCTPSRLAAYLANPEFTAALKNVRMVLSAGELLPPSLVADLKNKYGIRIYNGYGPTETTIGATITEAGDERTIGEPIGNTGILILNGNRQLVPLGAVGEICVYGAGVGLGYRGRAEETASKFIEWNGLRVYRTGDLGSFTEDGRVLYHGRNDRQIKLRGLRIELSEIEKVLGTYSGVTQANCVVRKIGHAEHIVGFFTADSEVNLDALRAHMKEKLTAYMVPDVLKQLPHMPQTPGGKTDLKALLAEPVELVRIYRAPETHAEKAICGAFAAVLGGEKIGADDNFFELGGDSLTSVELLLEIERALELEDGALSFSDIYKFPTPALLAEKLGGAAEVSSGYDLTALDYSGIDALLHAQNPQPVRKASLGNILLTGATGYLGIHILTELLSRPEICGKIYCLARSNARLSAEKRIKSALFYYDEADFMDGYGEKWVVLEGDISADKLFETAPDAHIDLIINSAANVAHFAYGDALEKVNTGGVKRLIDFALQEHATFCQVSTISVGGLFAGSSPKSAFTERDFYIGQEIHNQYIYSKFMAEYALLRAAVDNGLDVKIMRVGNLQGRSRDGEFQMNMKSNAFTRRLSAYIKMNAVPLSVYDAGVNFAPVDETAHMITELARTDGQLLFHVYPPEEASFAELFKGLEVLGHRVEVLSDSHFEKRLTALKQTKEGSAAIEGLVTERPDDRLRDVPVTGKITEALLEALGEHWRPITAEYLHRYLSGLDEMNMF